MELHRHFYFHESRRFCSFTLWFNFPFLLLLATHQQLVIFPFASTDSCVADFAQENDSFSIICEKPMPSTIRCWVCSKYAAGNCRHSAELVSLVFRNDLASNHPKEKVNIQSNSSNERSNNCVRASSGKISALRLSGAADDARQNRLSQRISVRADNVPLLHVS